MRLDKDGRPYHPAKFSKQILRKLWRLIPDDALVLDPFAGTGLIHAIEGIQAWGVEIEPEWATMHECSVIGDAARLPFGNCTFPYIVTSCVYGNRMSDHHDAKDSSVRNTYRHSLGRELHPNNAGQLHYFKGPRGFAYRELHRQAWREAWRVLRPSGYLILNVKNFVRNGEIVNVSGWHKWTLKQIGFELIERHVVSVRGNKHGANRNARVPHEFIYIFRKPSQEISEAS